MVFGKIRQAKQQAKEHKSKIAEKEEAAAAKPPYKHVPTHAAVDALSGAPSTWKAFDKTRIKEENKRKSQIAFSRTHSTLSAVSHMHQSIASNSRHLPRNSSHTGYNSAYFTAGESSSRPVSYYEPAYKRHKPSRGNSFLDAGIGPSPLGGSPTQSEDISSGAPNNGGNYEKAASTSSNSSDHLEIAATKVLSKPAQKEEKKERSSLYPKLGPELQKPVVLNNSMQDVFDRLHTNPNRKLGEAPISDEPLPYKAPPKAAPMASVEPKKKRWSLMGKKHAPTITT
ncbi:hypothetical protein B0O99DRAFT_648313 [Bisporella sp. PMI_857]|nr:hypothetical protein B0O99DRAFT_648313 [Bisporella sp. PMI_857]